jgi:quercetin dioxygenase-like cupin family protein
LKNSKVYKTVDIVDYLPNSVIIKSILRKTTGSVNAISFDAGEVLAGKISPFDTLIQMIEGRSEIIIEDISYLVEIGESIIIPAHCSNMIKANIRFKMITTTIKSGYEEVSL